MIEEQLRNIRGMGLMIFGNTPAASGAFGRLCVSQLQSG